MASIVTYLEIRENVVTNPSRFALGEARRVANAVGATVYALLTLPMITADQLVELATAVSVAGADRILCCMHHGLAGPPLDVTHGPLLLQVAKRLSSILYLFPAGGVGKELGAPLAIKLGGAFVRDAKIELSPRPFASDREHSPQVFLRRWRANGFEQRLLDVREIERPVIATLASGKPPVAQGESCREVEMLHYPSPLPWSPRVVSSHIDSSNGIELAHYLVVLDARISETTQRLVTTMVASDACVVRTDAIGLRSLVTASPSRLHWIAPGYPWDPGFHSLQVAPDCDAGFLGDTALRNPPLLFDQSNCQKEQDLLTLLEQQDQTEKGMG